MASASEATDHFGGEAGVAPGIVSGHLQQDKSLGWMEETNVKATLGFAALTVTQNSAAE
jgi:hypothetical protein